VGWMIKD